MPDPNKVFTEAQIKEFQRLFGRFDRDKDGKLDYREADILLRAVGLDLSREAADMLLLDVDHDFDLSLDWNQFLRAAAVASQGASQLEAEADAQPAQLPPDAFDIPDAEEDYTELKPLDQPTNEKLYRAFQLVDTNGDGSIDLRELEAMMLRMGKRPSPEEVQALMAQLDLDGDGKISFAEFSTHYFEQ